MLGLFKRKPQPVVITVTLNARLRPMNRGQLEDAFDDVCKKHGVDACVVGGGTLLAENGEIEACDIKVQLGDASDENVDYLRRVFTRMLAPIGSRIHLPDQDEPIEFGEHQGLALYLHGSDPPDTVYNASDINHVFDECGRLLGDMGMINSHWEGSTETALYMYGKDFEQMHSAIRPFLDSYPLCQQCRVERIA